jgi:phage portal protein BeeE
MLDWIRNVLGPPTTWRALGKSWEHLEAMLGLQRSATARQEHGWETRDNRQLEALYGNQDLVFAGVRKLATCARIAPARVAVRNADGEWADITLPQLRDDLLDFPNAQQTWSEYVDFRVMCLTITGVSWVLKIRNNAGDIDELHPFPTSWLRKRQGRYYLRQSNQHEILVPAEDLMACGFADPRHPGQYVGPIQVADKNLQVDEERHNTLGEMLRNAHYPGMILYQPEGYTDSQKRDIRRTLRDRIGPGRRGAPLFMSGEDADVKFPAPLADLDWPGLSGMTETRVCAILGIPPQILGVRAGEASKTYANYEQANKSFHRETIVPLWDMLAIADSRGILWNEGIQRNIQIYYDTSAIEALQEDQSARVERATKLWQSGLSSLNECRQMAGLDPLPDAEGDLYYQPMGAMIVSAAERAAPPEDPDAEKNADNDDADADDAAD